MFVDKRGESFCGLVLTALRGLSSSWAIAPLGPGSLSRSGHPGRGLGLGPRCYGNARRIQSTMPPSPSPLCSSAVCVWRSGQMHAHAHAKPDGFGMDSTLDGRWASVPGDVMQVPKTLRGSLLFACPRASILAHWLSPPLFMPPNKNAEGPAKRMMRRAHPSIPIRHAHARSQLCSNISASFQRTWKRRFPTRIWVLFVFFLGLFFGFVGCLLAHRRLSLSALELIRGGGVDSKWFGGRICLIIFFKTCYRKNCEGIIDKIE